MWRTNVCNYGWPFGPAITFYEFFIFFGWFKGGVISITFFPPRPRFSPIGQRKVQKSDFRWLSGAVNRGINNFFTFFQVSNSFVDEFKVRSAMKLYFSRNSCLIYSAITNEWFWKSYFYHMLDFRRPIGCTMYLFPI